MRWRLFRRADGSAEAEGRAMILLGVTLGLLVGCGVLGLLGIGVVVYFAAWCGDLLSHLGEAARKAGMILGLFVGVGLYLAVWSAAGGSAFWLLAVVGRKGRKNRAA